MCFEHLTILLYIREVTVCFATFTNFTMHSGCNCVLCKTDQCLPHLLCFLQPVILRVARRSNMGRYFGLRLQAKRREFHDLCVSQLSSSQPTYVLA
jgi:hypothetical protein